MKKLNEFRHIDFRSEAGYTTDPLIPAVLFVLVFVVIAVRLLLR